MSAAQFAAAAEALAGCKFRMHGRDPQTGLDCIGLFLAALAATGREAGPSGAYALRTSDPDRFLPDPATCGFAEVQGPLEPGDAVLLRSGPAQCHLAIALSEDRHIHSHAGLRRVVISPGLPAGAILHHWRIASNT